MGRGDPGRARHPDPAGVRPVQRWRALTRTERGDRRGDPRLGREDGETALHPSCTARMGIDEMSVTDPLTMKVHGLEGLRVVDASVMPYVTNGNIYAPVMMLAEKSASDLILGNTPSSRRKSSSTATGPAETGPYRRPPWPPIPPRCAHRDGSPGAKHAWYEQVLGVARSPTGRRTEDGFVR